MKRNLYIDAVKGLATLSIIFIHTTFWSGQLYVPYDVRVLSLLIDVPVFFFLSGFTSSGIIEKGIHRLLKLQITYMIFISLVFIYYSIYHKVWNSEMLFNWYIHEYSKSEPIEVVMGSMWYMKIYFLVAFWGLLVNRYMSKKQINILLIILLGGIVYFSFWSYPKGNTGYVFVYLFIFLLAKQTKNWRIRIPYILLGYFLLGCLYFYLFEFFNREKIRSINSFKFPPQILYLVFSCFSLFTILWLKNRITISKPNFLTYIGQNAVFFYFAQGVSSSIIYYFVNLWKDTLSWYFLLPIIFTINVSLAIIFAQLIKFVNFYAWKGIRYLKTISS